MSQRHCLKSCRPGTSPSAGVFAARYLFAMCGLPVTEQFASVSKSANLPPTHVASKHQRDLLGRTSNAATSGSTSVQMAIIVSLHKITKERGCQAGSGVAGGCAGGGGSHKAVRAKRISTGYGNNPHIGRERKTWMQPSICKPKWRIWQGAS